VTKSGFDDFSDGSIEREEANGVALVNQVK
jgi:hypothetical protein